MMCLVRIMKNTVAVFSTKHLTVFENWIANKIRCLKKAVAPGLMLNVVVSEFQLSWTKRYLLRLLTILS